MAVSMMDKMTASRGKHSGVAAFAPHMHIHPESTLQAISQLHADHQRQSSQMARAVDRMTAVLGSPTFLALISVVICGSIASNIIMPLAGYHAFDPLPFSWLSSALTLLALYVAILILATQRRADQLGSRSGELALEPGMLNEQKTAKIIELLGCGFG